jgi:hypothetical protein
MLVEVHPAMGGVVIVEFGVAALGDDGGHVTGHLGAHGGRPGAEHGAAAVALDL